MNNNVVNINDVEYDFDTMTDTAKTAYQQLLSLRNQMADLQMRSQQIAAAQSVFEQALESELEKAEPTEEIDAVVNE